MELAIPGGVARFNIAVEALSPFNNKPNVNIQLQIESDFPMYAELILVGEEGRVNLWCENGFFDLGLEGFTTGDSDISCGEIGGTAAGIISVGAYTTRTSYTDLSGEMRAASGDEVGNLAPFSSHGPTVDGRTKPDIAAPGDVVLSSLNNAHEGFEEVYPPVFQSEEGGVVSIFGASSGTSMSSPMTAGIVALLLEADPELNVDEVKELLRNTARIDDFTGQIPEAGSNLWGWGKIDALAALSALAPAATSCATPAIATVELRSPRMTRISWDRVEDATKYVFQIRFKGMTSWLVTANINFNRANIYAPSDRTYEFRVATLCGEEMSDFGPVQEYTTSSLIAPVAADSRDKDLDKIETITIDIPEFSVFPNPVTDLLTVEYEGAKEGILSIYHASGVKVKEIPTSVNASFYQVNMSQLSDGYYLIKVEEPGKTPVNQRIVKQSFR